ncbi:hypothetical protein GCM10025863_10970 [Microbacterium suwonense]|uniref:Uncharacterized protein n=1 Tax=Microbacterium suwonense TaxID=683047 RepID=A0ABM8FSL0_9MICO|nr:hypothetical protein GCM10025863_10970 [Microbacterium suwonense]
MTTLNTLRVNRFDFKYDQNGVSHDAMLQSIGLYGEKVVPMVKDMLG